MHFVIMNTDAQLPTRATSGSAGYDFYAPEDYTLAPGESRKIDLGVAQASDLSDIFNFANCHYVILMTIRSSLAYKAHLSAVNPVAVIDSDFSGTIEFGLRNDGLSTYDIKKGDRICQAVIVPFMTATNDTVLAKSRDGGIGSTGK